MSGILGTLGITEAAAERTFISTVGQQLVYEAVQAELAKYSAELTSVMSLFVEQNTTDYKRRYELPGGGYLEPLSALGSPANVKATGKWDVAWPIADYGAAFSRDRVGRAYMTVQQLNKHLDTIMIQDRNTVRREIMKALLSNTQYSFVDPIWGTLLVEPLANGDSVVYPPVLGSADEATDDHYIETNYAAASISNTNDPTKTVRDELEEHFGTPTGGSNIVMLTTPTVCDYIEALTDFDPVNQRYVTPGANTDQVSGLPAGMPGRVRGICNSVWIVEWRSMPANYALAIHADAPKPLIMREDPPETGLAGGLNLVAEDEKFPFRSSIYSHRFGFGAGNRLNGVALEFGTGGSYSIPSGYSRP
jgi:hypothetical protein